MSTGTQVEVVMPQMGVSVSEGTVTRWLKQPGEPVTLDEPLLEISTDKVDTEIPSPGEGVLAEIRVQEGETVEVGTLLAVIAPAGAAPADAEAGSGPAPETDVAAQEPPVAEADAPRRSRRLRQRRCPPSRWRRLPLPKHPPRWPRAAQRHGGTSVRGASVRRASVRRASVRREREDVRVARRRADRGPARGRPGRRSRVGPGRPRHEEGHPGIHRGRGCSAVPGTRSAGTHRDRRPGTGRSGAGTGRS